jgi:hypothetical protein
MNKSLTIGRWSNQRLTAKDQGRFSVLQLLHQRSTHFFLVSGIQFGAGACHMENVCCGLTLRIDNRNFDVAA